MEGYRERPRSIQESFTSRGEKSEDEFKARLEREREERRIAEERIVRAARNYRVGHAPGSDLKQLGDSKAIPVVSPLQVFADLVDVTSVLHGSLRTTQTVSYAK